MSGMLYSLAIEPMLCQIRKELIGVKLRDHFSPLHLSANAYDIMVAVKGDSDVQKLIHITECFGKISSSKVNWDKSTAFLGKWQGNEPRLPDGFKWLKNGIKYLGDHLGDHSEVMKNWEGVVEKMEGKLKKWH